VLCEIEHVLPSMDMRASLSRFHFAYNEN